MSYDDGGWGWVDTLIFDFDYYLLNLFNSIENIEKYYLFERKKLILTCLLEKIKNLLSYLSFDEVFLVGNSTVGSCQLMLWTDFPANLYSEINRDTQSSQLLD